MGVLRPEDCTQSDPMRSVTGFDMPNLDHGVPLSRCHLTKAPRIQPQESECASRPTPLRWAQLFRKETNVLLPNSGHSRFYRDRREGIHEVAPVRSPDPRRNGDRVWPMPPLPADVPG